MLTSVEIENFQSLRKMSLKLGRFTVVTGATGSGKSSVFRAMELLAFNARGTSYITRGEKTCKVAAGEQESGWRSASSAVAAVRMPTGSRRMCRWPLRLRRAGGKFTKLGGEVPPQVSETAAAVRAQLRPRSSACRSCWTPPAGRSPGCWAG